MKTMFLLVLCLLSCTFGFSQVFGEVKSNTLDSLKAIYSHRRLTYESFEWGDLLHFGFVDEKGEHYDISVIEDYSYELLGDNDVANPAYVGKTFDIFYKVEKRDLMDWGEEYDYDVVKHMILVEE